MTQDQYTPEDPATPADRETDASHDDASLLEPDPYVTDVVSVDEAALLSEVVFQSVPEPMMPELASHPSPDSSEEQAAEVGGELAPTRRIRGPRFLGRRAVTASTASVTSTVVLEGPVEATGLVEIPPVQAVPPSQLDAQSISAWFGEHQVLHDVSLTMPAGQITALIGPSGCGKSTFLRILNRMHELIPSAALAGEVRLDGDDIYDSGHRLVDARKQIGMVFQKPNPFPAMSIYDNVVAGLRLTGVRAGRSDKDDHVEQSLTRAGLWKEVKDRLRAPGGGLSGGQQQRLCIARALAVKPRVLLMDEPCSALDPTSTRVIEETMLELASDVTIVIVTHNMQQAQRVSSQCAFFLAAHGEPGHIVEHGDTDAMFTDPIDPRTFDYVNGRFG